MVDYSSGESPNRSTKQQGDEYSPDIADTLIMFKAKIRSCKEDNDRIIQSQERLVRAQEKQVEVDAMFLQSLSYL